MSILSYIIFVTSLLLQLGLVFRLIVNKCWRKYFWPFLYVCYTLVIMNLVLFAILKFRPDLYKGSYWQCESISIGLRFFVIWDVFRQTFRTVPTVYRTVSKGLAVLALIPMALSLSSLLTLGSYGRFIHAYFAVERSFDFVQGFLLLSMLAAARYYGLRLGRNVWGVAVGFGAYLSVSTMIFSMFDLGVSIEPFMQVLSPLSFVAMLAVWTWALWVYAPNPEIAVDKIRAQKATIRWWEAWGQMLNVINLIKRTRNI